MLLTRAAVAVGVAVVLLPSDPEKQQALLASAQENAVWAATYCDREPEQCAQAKVTWDGLVAKAQFGVQLAGELADRYSRSQQGVATDAGYQEVAGGEWSPPAEPALEHSAAAAPQPAPRVKSAMLKPIPVRVHRAPAAALNDGWDQFQPD